VRRDWSDTNATASSTVSCRVCSRTLKLERAHVIGRARDRGKPSAYDVVMLCVEHHRLYDAHELDLYPKLTDEEREHAVFRAGGAGKALRRLMGKAWRSASDELLDARLEHLLELEVAWQERT
jgi:hypothetical protein